MNDSRSLERSRGVGWGYTRQASAYMLRPMLIRSLARSAAAAVCAGVAGRAIPEARGDQGEDLNFVSDLRPRSVVKPDGRVIALASRDTMRKAFVGGARVLDVRDPNEVVAARGGTAATGALHVPINVGGEAQSAHPTSVYEFKAALDASGIPSTPQTFIVHCTGGGRAEKAVKLLSTLGHTAYNGGSADDVRECYERVCLWKEGEHCADCCAHKHREHALRWSDSVHEPQVICRLEVVGYHGQCADQNRGRIRRSTHH